MDEGHKTRYSIHHGATKMYQDLKKNYWWPGMKRERTNYVSRCLTCLQVKVEHQKPYRKIQQLEMPEGKWELLTMDIITKIPRIAKGYDTIWVVVVRLTKSARFLPISKTHTSEKLAELVIREIVARHGMHASIVSDRDTHGLLQGSRRSFTRKWELDCILARPIILIWMVNLKEPSKLLKIY